MAKETKKEEPKKSWLDSLIGGLGDFASSEGGQRVLGGLLAQAVTGGSGMEGFVAGGKGVQDAQNQAFKKRQIALKNKSEADKQAFDEKYKTDYLSYLNKTLKGKEGTGNVDSIVGKIMALDEEQRQSLEKRYNIDEMSTEEADAIFNAVSMTYPELGLGTAKIGINEKKHLLKLKAERPELYYSVLKKMAGIEIE